MTSTLNCHVRADDSNHAFYVKIGKKELVADLKEAIKDKRKSALDYVDTHTLSLRKVSVPFNESLKENVEQLVLANDESLQRLLRPFDILSHIFSYKLRKGDVHVIVDRQPPPG